MTSFPLLFVLLLSFLVALTSGDPTFMNKPYLESQFLRIKEEIKAAGDKYSGDLPDITESEHKVWYRTQITTDPAPIERKWKLIKTGYQYQPHDIYHELDNVNLTFSFPFYGRMIDRVTLSTSGAILLGDESAAIHIPSHIAPSLSKLSPGNDKVKFKDTGNKFIVHWTFHHVPDTKRRQEVQLWIYRDGSMTIIYHNLLAETLEMAKDNTHYPVIIGLQDGWAVPPDENSNVINVYQYPALHENPEELVGEWTMLQILPSNLNPSCQKLESESDCRANDKCAWCNGGQCLYKMEQKRPGNQCSTAPTETPVQKEENDCSNITCSNDNSPVCGSNGITYDNQCFLKKYSCIQGSDIGLQKQGACGADQDQEECPSMCTTDYRPICGSDGKTYSNRCNLKAYQCNKGHLEVKFLHEGECSDQDYDYQQKEDPDDDEEDEQEEEEQAKEQNEVNEEEEGEDCEESCDRLFDPVCVNKKRQFSNKCVMDVAVCKEKIQVDEYFKGNCPAATDSGTKDGNSISDNVGTSSVDCSDVPVGCPKILAPVCASNGQTYESECIFKLIVCEQNIQNLNIVRSGSCEEEPQEGEQVPPAINVSNVENDERTVEDEGEIDKEDEQISGCEETVCTRELNPVCGNDGKTYGNPCLLEAEAKCDPGLVMAYQGDCQDLESVEKANEIPVVSEEAGPDHHNHSSNFVKGLVFLTIVIGISLMAVAMVKLYRRSKSNFPPTRQGEQIGIPNSVVNHGGAPGNSSSTGIVPVTQTQIIGGSAAAAASGGVELSIVSGAAGGTARQTAKYDKLPLVPNIDGETR